MLLFGLLDTSAGVLAPAVVVVTPPEVGGGHRIANKYSPLSLRRAHWRACKRKLDEERRRLAQLKREVKKIEKQIEAKALPIATAFALPELQFRITEQASVIRDLRKVVEQAQRHAEQKGADADEQELRAAYDQFQAQEAQRLDALRIEAETEIARMEADDEEMMTLCFMAHEDVI